MTVIGAVAVDPRLKSGALWGVVGALSFLVLVLGYQLAGGQSVDPSVMGGVTAVVGVAAAGLSYLLEARLANQRP